MIRHIGFDDGFFVKTEPSTVLVGTVVRGNSLVEGFLVGNVSVDGDDATDILADMIMGSKFIDTLKAVFLKGVTLAGFNVVDIRDLHRRINLPVIVVLRRLPNMDEISRALMNVKNAGLKMRRIKAAGRIYELPRPRGKLYFQKSGITKNDAIQIIETSIRTGNIPESLRLSHLVASAIALGESRRRA